MPPKSVHMISTIHTDYLNGPVRLGKLLNYLRPDVVAVEYCDRRAKIHSDMIVATEKNGMAVMRSKLKRVYGVKPKVLRRLNKSINVPLLDAILLGSDYEYSVSKKYCERNHKGIVLIDKPMGNGGDDESAYFSDDPNAVLVTSEEYCRSVDVRYKPTSISQENIEGFSERDKYMAVELASLSGRVVFVGGLGHIHGKYNNLFDRMLFANPVKMMLIEADGLDTERLAPRDADKL
jgi:hypothetical protein